MTWSALDPSEDGYSPYISISTLISLGVMRDKPLAGSYLREKLLFNTGNLWLPISSTLCQPGDIVV